MCAIAGVLDLPVEAAVVDKMLSTMKRRGPDEQGTAQTERCCLLHTRLTVVDPEGGKQPISLSWQGARYTMVYNGELYNTQELRDKLEALGHSFRSHSDTEVLIHAFAHWGEGCLQQLNGIFAFAVWDHKNQRLFLARDRMGVKPAFFMRWQGGFLFASEIKTILAYPGVKPQLDAAGAAEILLLGPGRTPGNGVFRNVEELEGGCFGWYDKGSFTVKRYWRLRDREHRESFEETAEVVRYLVTDAIKRQMVSDVPIGTFLSGGLDSSLITAICAEQLREMGGMLSTFSVDYEKNDQYFTPNKFQPNSDNAYIRLMQSVENTDHYWCVLTPQMLLEELDHGVRARDLPGMADVDLSLLAFCRQIKDHVTVALSGECADEIFGGYPWYRDPEIRGLDGFPWAQNTDQRLRMLAPAVAGKVDGRDYIYSRYEKTCRDSDILPENSPLDRRMKEMVNLNHYWFMQTLLDRKDRMSMYSGLEVRVPFCDYRIAEYLYAVPWAFKDYQGQEKGLLRYAMEGVLPKEVLWRKKSPYPKTHDPAYLELVTQKMEQLLEKGDAPLLDLVRKDAILDVIREEHSWPWYGQLMKRPQTIAYLLQINSWLEQYDIELLF